jgi:hypothetical protein
LGKGEVGIEAATGEVIFFVELTGIGDLFIYQNETGRILIEHVFQQIARIGAGFIGLPNHVVGFSAAELPSNFTPKSADDCAICFGFWLSRG